jgi:hypothetical protein
MRTLRTEFALTVYAAMCLMYASGSIAQDVSGGSRVIMPGDLKWSESPRAPACKPHLS